MKTIFLSKTFWTFFMLFIAAILNLTGLINLDLDPDASWVTIVLSVIAIFLRIVTKKPISW